MDIQLYAILKLGVVSANLGIMAIGVSTLVIMVNGVRIARKLASALEM